MTGPALALGGRLWLIGSGMEYKPTPHSTLVGATRRAMEGGNMPDVLISWIAISLIVLDIEYYFEGRIE